MTATTDQVHVQVQTDDGHSLVLEIDAADLDRFEVESR